jgi:hypothetical protein
MRLAALAAASVLVAPAPALAYGAIALGACQTPGSGWGMSYNQPSPEIANALAVQECSKHTSNCRVTMPVVRQCFAIALDFSSGGCGHDGEAASQYLTSARREAYNACQRVGGTQCTIVVGVCDDHN